MKKAVWDPGFQNQHIESKIVVALERISEAFRVLLWQESKTHGLSPIQVQVLIFLNHHDEAKRKVSYLADEFNMTKATISDTVRILLQKDLITKACLPHDTRSYIIHLTAKGREIAAQTAQFTQELQHPIDLLPSADKETLLLSLTGIIRHLNKAGIITIQRMCFTCSHYQPGHGGQAHFCRLLNQPLAHSELRVDCPEHAPADPA